MTGSDLIGLATVTLRDPRMAARQLLAMNLPAATGLIFIVLAAAGSSLLLHLGLGTGATPMPVDPLTGALFGSPFTTALVQGGALCLAVALIHGVGRAFGGRGNLEEVALVFGWLQVLLLAVQALQFTLQFVVPILAPVIGLVAFVVFFYCLVQFIAEVHGFQRPLLVLLGIIGTFIVATLILSMVIGAALAGEVAHV